MRTIASQLLLALIALAAYHPAARAGDVFTLIADSNTAIPGGTGNFSSSSFVSNNGSISGNAVTFQGLGSGGQQGIYSATIGGGVSLVADTNTAVPGGAGNFEGLSLPVISGNTVVFNAIDASSHPGIFAATIGGGVSVVANTSTAVPGGTGNFTSMGGTSISGNTIVFEAGGTRQAGIYTSGPGGLAVVANLSTPIPGGSGDFRGLSTHPAISGGTVVFEGTNASGQAGIYTSGPGGLAVVANTSTAIPGSSGNFSAFGNQPVISGSNVVFEGSGSGSAAGLYAAGPGGITLLANAQTDDPAGGGLFTDFTSYAVSGNTVAFIGIKGIGQNAIGGLYVENLNGTGLTQVVGLGDVIDGNTVSGAGVYGMGPFGFSGSTIVFDVGLSDGTVGLYAVNISSVPEPGSGLLLALGVAGVAGTGLLRARQGQRACR